MLRKLLLFISILFISYSHGQNTDVKTFTRNKLIYMGSSINESRIIGKNIKVEYDTLFKSITITFTNSEGERQTCKLNYLRKIGYNNKYSLYEFSENYKYNDLYTLYKKLLTSYDIFQSSMNPILLDLYEKEYGSKQKFFNDCRKRILISFYKDLPSEINFSIYTTRDGGINNENSTLTNTIILSN